MPGPNSGAASLRGSNEDRLRNSGATRANPFGRLLQMQPTNLSFYAEATKAPMVSSFSGQAFPRIHFGGKLFVETKMSDIYISIDISRD